MVLQDQFETLARVHSLMEGDLNRTVELLSSVHFFDSTGNRRRIAG